MKKRKMKVKNNIKPILGGILMLSLFVGASYAFIYSSSSELFNGALTFKDGFNVAYSLTTKTDLNYQINPLDLQEGGSEYVESQPAEGIVMLGNNSDYNKIKCGYEIWYNPTTVYENSAGAQNLEEMVIIGLESSGQNTPFRFNLNGVSAETRLATAYITATGENADITQKWQFTLRHYNLDVNQNDNIGKNFGGTISFRPLGCEDAS